MNDICLIRLLKDGWYCLRQDCLFSLRMLSLCKYFQDGTRLDRNCVGCSYCLFLAAHVPFLVRLAVGKQLLLVKLFLSVLIPTLSCMLVVGKEEMKWQRNHYS